MEKYLENFFRILYQKIFSNFISKIGVNWNIFRKLLTVVRAFGSFLLYNLKLFALWNKAFNECLKTFNKCIKFADFYLFWKLFLFLQVLLMFPLNFLINFNNLEKLVEYNTFYLYIKL